MPLRIRVSPYDMPPDTPEGPYVAPPSRDPSPPIDPNFLNQYMTTVEEGPDTRQEFTLPLARAHRAQYERPGLLGHWFGGARDVAPPVPWDPDKPKPDLAPPPQETPFEYAVKPFTNIGRGLSMLGGVVRPPRQPEEDRPITAGLPPTQRSLAEDAAYEAARNKFALDTGLNMIGAGRLPSSSPPGSFGAGGGAAPTLRGRAGEEAWRTGTAAERLATTNHPFGGGGTPIRDMPKPIIEGAPEIKPKKIDVEKDLKNAELIFMPGDATGAGGRLLGFPGMTFENPVARLGGPGYSYAVSGQPGPQRLWASDKGPMTGIFNVAKGVEARGNVPWGVYMTGAKPYMDQSTQMVNTAIEAAKATGVSKEMNDHLVKVMRSDWNVPANKELLFPKKGLNDPEAVQWWLDNQPMPQHSKLVKAMGTAEAEKLGFPNMSVLRVGNTDPRLLTAQPGSAGLMLGRIDTSKGLINPSYHPDYNTAIATSGAPYTFGRQLPTDVIAATMHQQRVNQIRPLREGQPSAYLNAPHLYYGAGGTAQKTEPVTNQWKDTVQNWLANNPEQRIGGVVLGAGANDPKSVALAAGLNAVRDQGSLGGTVRVRTPQGTINEIPAWMNRPRDYFPDMPGGVTIDKSLPMDVNSVMSRWMNSPYKREAYHWTNAQVPFSQFKHAEALKSYERDFGIHAGTAGQAENRAYNKGALVPEDIATQQQLASINNNYGQTYKLLVDPGPRGFLPNIMDSGTWGPTATRGHLEQSGRFTPQELHRVERASDDLERLKGYRDLVKSKGYGGLEYLNTGEVGGDVTRLSQERDRLFVQFQRERDFGKRLNIDNKINDLNKNIDYLRNNPRETSIAIADPGQIRVPGAMFDPRNYRNPFILGAGANDPRSVALAAGASAVRDPQLGSTVRSAAEPIRAYHSSPHDFDRFDWSKIGTGEGHQTYGHGIYAAENPAVSGQGGQYWRQFKHRFAYSSAEMEAIGMLQNHNFDREKAIAELTDLKRYQPGYLEGATGAFDRGVRQHIIDKNNEALELLKSGKIVGPRTYEVNIHARPEQLLNYDAPLSGQPAAVQDLLRKSHRYDIAKVGDSRWEVRHPGGWVPNAAQNFYRSEEAALKAAEGLNVGRTVPDLIPRSAEQSQRFVEAGVPGIRYLDEGSRGGLPSPETIAKWKAFVAEKEAAHARDPWLIDPVNNTWGKRNLEAVNTVKEKIAQAERGPTSNYVVFDPGIIEIAKKYGIPGMLGAGALGETVRQDRYGG